MLFAMSVMVHNLSELMKILSIPHRFSKVSNQTLINSLTNYLLFSETSAKRWENKRKNRIRAHFRQT